jgi:hypothetical protein
MLEPVRVVFLFRLLADSPQNAEWILPVCVFEVLKIHCHFLSRVLHCRCPCVLQVQVRPLPRPRPLHHCLGGTQEPLRRRLPQP